MNRCGGLVDWRGAPLLRAHGAAVGASLVVLVVRHGGHQLTLCTSLSTGPHRSGASSDTSSRSLIAVHLKNKGQEVTLSHLLRLPHSLTVLMFMPDAEPPCHFQAILSQAYSLKKSSINFNFLN